MEEQTCFICKQKLCKNELSKKIKVGNSFAISHTTHKGVEDEVSYVAIEENQISKFEKRYKSSQTT